MTIDEYIKYIWDNASDLIYGIYLMGSSQNTIIDNPHDTDVLIILNDDYSKMNLINKIHLYEIEGRPENLDMSIHSKEEQMTRDVLGAFWFLQRINTPKCIYGQEYNFITHKSQVSSLTLKIEKTKRTAKTLYNLYNTYKIKHKRWYHLYVDYVFLINEDDYELTDENKEKIIRFHNCEITDEELTDLYNKIMNLKEEDIQ